MLMKNIVICQLTIFPLYVIYSTCLLSISNDIFINFAESILDTTSFYDGKGDGWVYILSTTFK